MIPFNVQQRLVDHVWLRPSSNDVLPILSNLGIDSTSDFAVFFIKYWGPFRSLNAGIELLDIVEGDESIISNTMAVREEYGFPERFIVVTSLSGGGVLVYDNINGAVYDVDFEGGDNALVSGELKPRWPSWNDFISKYFG